VKEVSLEVAAATLDIVVADLTTVAVGANRPLGYACRSVTLAPVAARLHAREADLEIAVTNMVSVAHPLPIVAADANRTLVIATNFLTTLFS